MRLSGVLQGSHLGPILYTISINHLSDCIRFARCLICADDVKLFCSINSVSYALRLQGDLINMNDWAKVNGLTINPSKCNEYLFIEKSTYFTLLYT